MSEAGELRTVVACAACRERAIAIVAPPPSTFTTVPSDDADVVAVLRGLAKHLKGIGAAFESESNRVSVEAGVIFAAKRDGLEQAADIAETWANERAARQPATDMPEQKRNDR